MGDHQHGHAFGRQLLHHLQDLPDQLRVKGGSRLIKENEFRIRGNRTRNPYPLLLPS